MGMIIAMISGALMSLQGVFNTGASKEAGEWVTNVFVQFTALLVCFLFWFFKEREKHDFFDLLLVEPKYMLLGGVIGAFITITVIWSTVSLGPAKAVLFIVVSQIAASYLIEAFGLFGVEKTGFAMHKILGLLIAAGGILLFQWKS